MIKRRPFGGFADAPEAAIDLVVFAVPEPERFEVCLRPVSSTVD